MTHNREPLDTVQLAKDDEWLDEALRDSFPASDPIPMRHTEDADDPGTKAPSRPTTRD